MAAGDVTHLMVDTTTKKRTEYKKVTTNGTNAVVIPHGLATVDFATATWAEDIGATACSIEITVTNGNTATLTCSGAVTKDCYVALMGS